MAPKKVATPSSEGRSQQFLYKFFTPTPQKGREAKQLEEQSQEEEAQTTKAAEPKAEPMPVKRRPSREDFKRWGALGGKISGRRKAATPKSAQRAKKKDGGGEGGGAATEADGQGREAWLAKRISHKRQRFQPDAKEQVLYAEYIQHIQGDYADDRNGWILIAQEVKRNFGLHAIWRPVKKFKKMLSDLAKNKARVKARNKYKKSRYDKVPTNVPKEGASKAGRKSAIQHIKDLLATKLDTEEQTYGHSVTAADIVWHFKELLAKRLLDLKTLQARRLETEEELTEQEQAEKTAIESKLRTFQSRKTHKQSERDIVDNLGRSTYSINRKTILTPQEEMIRGQLTWKDFDWMLYLCAFSKPELGAVVADMEKWKSLVHTLILEFEDEVPFWIGLQDSRVTVKKGERAKANKDRRLRRAQKRKREASASGEGGAGEEAEEEEEELQEGAENGVRQVRGLEAKGEDKHRVTFLNRLTLSGVLQQGSAPTLPKGALERSVWIVQGKHCSMQFVTQDSEGRDVWSEDWGYELEGVAHNYKKGESCGKLMQPYRTLYRKKPELFRDVLLIQQPSATRDGIVVNWCMKDLNARHELVLQQHDMLGAQATKEVKRLRSLLNQPDTLLAPDMTAVQQLVDIMTAKKSKDVMFERTIDIKRLLIAKSTAKGEDAKFSIGPEELMVVANWVHQGLQEWLSRYDFVLHGLRQAGTLAYLPDLETGRLRKFEEFFPEMRTLAQEVGIGQRIDAKWLEERYSWIGEDGYPEKPDWNVYENLAEDIKKARVDARRH